MYPKTVSSLRRNESAPFCNHLCVFPFPQFFALVHSTSPGEHSLYNGYAFPKYTLSQTSHFVGEHIAH
jgi:hypothetical protein